MAICVLHVSHSLFFHANGHLPLLQATGHYFVRGQTTGEVGRVPAPPHPGTWQLELDDAGVAFLAPGEDGEEQLVAVGAPSVLASHLGAAPRRPQLTGVRLARAVLLDPLELAINDLFLPVDVRAGPCLLNDVEKPTSEVEVLATDQSVALADVAEPILALAAHHAVRRAAALLLFEHCEKC